MCIKKKKSKICENWVVDMVVDPLKINSSAPCQLHPEFFSIRKTDSGEIKLNEGVTENFLVMMLISKYFSKV